jgi:hypothetical protein
MSVLFLTLPSPPGLSAEARPLTECPPDGVPVFLYSERRRLLVAVARFAGGAWEIVHERFPYEPTHWIKPNVAVLANSILQGAPSGSGRLSVCRRKARSSRSQGERPLRQELHD